MRVSLISYTSNPELVVAVAARTSFRSETPTEIMKELASPENAEKIKKTILELLKHNHLSPIEHASFTFIIEGVSRACTHQLVRHRIASWYEELSNKGVEKEDARFILPQATKTNIVVTMNAREILHFFNLRLCARTQWELREVAMEMLRLVKRVAPTIFKDAGPSCMKGFCPEGDLMPEECRKIGIPNIQRRFREIT
ncbi:MAG: FAD-dependent thymidylate synthase [Nitrososphaerota archaeon]|nr:FAD-dependent thymidylate synthase [Nitrososphaerota archaeon]